MPSVSEVIAEDLELAQRMREQYVFLDSDNAPGLTILSTMLDEAAQRGLPTSDGSVSRTILAVVANAAYSDVIRSPFREHSITIPKASDQGSGGIRS